MSTESSSSMLPRDMSAESLEVPELDFLSDTFPALNNTEIETSVSSIGNGQEQSPPKMKNKRSSMALSFDSILTPSDISANNNANSNQSAAAVSGPTTPLASSDTAAPGISTHGSPQRLVSSPSYEPAVPIHGDAEATKRYLQSKYTAFRHSTVESGRHPAVLPENTEEPRCDGTAAAVDSGKPAGGTNQRRFLSALIRRSTRIRHGVTDQSPRQEASIESEANSQSVTPSMNDSSNDPVTAAEAVQSSTKKGESPKGIRQMLKSAYSRLARTSTPMAIVEEHPAQPHSAGSNIPPSHIPTAASDAKRIPADHDKDKDKDKDTGTDTDTDTDTDKDKDKNKNKSNNNSNKSRTVDTDTDKQNSANGIIVDDLESSSTTDQRHPASILAPMPNGAPATEIARTLTQPATSNNDAGVVQDEYDAKAPIVSGTHTNDSGLSPSHSLTSSITSSASRRSNMRSDRHERLHSTQWTGNLRQSTTGKNPAGTDEDMSSLHHSHSNHGFPSSTSSSSSSSSKLKRKTSGPPLSRKHSWTRRDSLPFLNANHVPAHDSREDIAMLQLSVERFTHQVQKRLSDVESRFRDLSHHMVDLSRDLKYQRQHVDNAGKEYKHLKQRVDGAFEKIGDHLGRAARMHNALKKDVASIKQGGLLHRAATGVAKDGDSKWNLLLSYFVTGIFTLLSAVLFPFMYVYRRAGSIRSWCSSGDGVNNNGIDGESTGQETVSSGPSSPDNGSLNGPSLPAAAQPSRTAAAARGTAASLVGSLSSGNVLADANVQSIRRRRPAHLKVSHEPASLQNSGSKTPNGAMGSGLGSLRISSPRTRTSKPKRDAFSTL
jgi:hypothetical protein